MVARMAAQSQGTVYACGVWEIDLAQRELRAGGFPVTIGGRALEILAVLAQSAGELVSKDDLMGRIWPGAVVEDNTLQVHISAVRKALGRDRAMLKTASGRGYRLLGTWTQLARGALPEMVRHRRSLIPPRPFTSNLPAAISDLVGRKADLAELRDVLTAYRVTTLVGPGGIGKTALALEVARGAIADGHEQVCLVELASLSDPNLVPTAAASALGLTLGGEAISPQSVARAVGTTRLFLVLDNCEHVIDAAARLAEAMARLCSRVTILATSREALRIDGEYAYRVAPLDIPRSAQAGQAEVLDHSAVQLFIKRTTALQSDFAPSQDELSVIASICRNLDGIPLAIEFAAARAAALGVSQVAARLDDRFGLLTGGRRTALPRQQTLRATLDWSYQLLPEAEKRLLRRLAVFPAGFTMEGAIAVATDAESAATAVLEGVTNLVAKSLVVLDGPSSRGRWRLLETIRAYALEKLVAQAESRDAARRHGEFARAQLERAEAEWEILPAVRWLADHRYLIDSARAALGWAFASDGDAATGVALTVACVPLWFQLSLMAECAERVKQALAAPDSCRDRKSEMRLYAALAWSLMQTRGSVPETRAAWTKVLEIADEVGDVDHQLRAMWGLWAGLLNGGELTEALDLARRFYALGARQKDPMEALIGDRLIGYILHLLGDQAGARRHLERMVSQYVAPVTGAQSIRYIFDQRVTANCFLARIMWLQGFPDQAMREVERIVEGAIADGNTLSLCQALVQAACPVALFAGDLERLERFVAMLLDYSTTHGLGFWGVWGRCFQGTLLARRGDHSAGVALLDTALSELRGINYGVYYVTSLGEFARALGSAGRVQEGLDAIDAAIRRSEANGELWCMAELLRIKAELLLQSATANGGRTAEELLSQSLVWARRQGAASWELRSALSLARIKMRQGLGSEAPAILAPAYVRFTEGFDTEDLRAAKSILDSPPLSSRRADQSNDM